MSRGETLDFADWHSIEDGTDYLFLNPDAPWRKWLVKQVSTDVDGNPRPIVAKSEDSLFEAIWDNPILRRWLRIQGVVVPGYIQAWSEPKLNRHINLRNDDIPDMSLLLYAQDGDTILTDDSIKDRIRHIDVEKCINVMTWDDWLETHRTESSIT